ncbi:CA216 protein, partial [Eudromia elegans]|nr:CA216 protein [Eudromia elegans]
MFAVCQPDATVNSSFREGPMLGAAFAGEGAQRLGADTNSNFVAGDYDRNENWTQPVPAAHSKTGTNPADNLLLLMPRQLVRGRPRDAAQSPRGNPERLPAAMRSPPEGAEASGTGDGSSSAEDPTKLPSSPMEDNGYGSSSLSIDSPDSVCSGTLEPPTATNIQKSSAELALPEQSPDADSLFPVLAEAFQHIQDKERFKEREKEKHHVQLVMYRRLALLRWIHSLQQKVVEQQSRLQESFDTILDNRKEIIRFIQQGLAGSSTSGCA